jgi:hypothetical protein
MTLLGTHLADRVIAAQAADNNALALSVSVPDLRGAPAGPLRRTEKVIEMTATQQQGNPVTRFAKTVIRYVRSINGELTGAGEAMARSNRFPQPSPQAGLEQAKQAHPAGKVLAGV